MRASHSGRGPNTSKAREAPLRNRRSLEDQRDTAQVLGHPRIFFPRAPKLFILTPHTKTLRVRENLKSEASEVPDLWAPSALSVCDSSAMTTALAALEATGAGAGGPAGGIHGAPQSGLTAVNTETPLVPSSRALQSWPQKCGQRQLGKQERRRNY